mgnify:CR=1 FL=1
MVEITLLSEADLRRCVALDDQAIGCVEDGFRALSTGTVVMPPVLSLAIREANGEVDVKTAYVPGLPSFAIKVSPGFFDNPAIGLPSTSGLMMLFCARTGQVQALLLDNGYLTDIRTAAAGAVAARHLARADAARACILGAGMQARMQLRALSLVRPIRRATFWARDPARAEAAAREMGAELGIEATACADPAACVAGELRSAVESGILPADARFPELGEIAAGSAPGRTTPEQITIADLTGTGVQDTVIAIHALRRARARGLGTLFNT